LSKVPKSLWYILPEAARGASQVFFPLPYQIPFTFDFAGPCPLTNLIPSNPLFANPLRTPQVRTSVPLLARGVELSDPFASSSFFGTVWQQFPTFPYPWQFSRISRLFSQFCSVFTPGSYTYLTQKVCPASFLSVRAFLICFLL